MDEEEKAKAEAEAKEKAEAEAKEKAEAEEREQKTKEVENEDKKLDEEEKEKQEKENQEKEKISDSEAKLLKENMKRKESEKKLQEQLNAANARLKDFEGLEASEVRKLLDAQKEAEKAKLEQAGEFERVKEMILKENQEKLSAQQKLLEEAEARSKALQAQIEELTVGQNFATSNFIQEKLLLTPSKARVIYGSHFDVKDGKTIAYDKPRGSESRTPLVDANGEPVSFEIAIQKLVEADPDRDRILKSTLKPGADSNSEGKRVEDKPELRGMSRIAAALAAQKAAKK